MDMTIPRYNLDTCSVLVSLNASVWTARKLDRSTTNEVVANKNAASKDAARVNKNLLAGRKELEVVQNIVGQARNYLSEKTVPWSDGGLRMLPSVMLLEVDKQLSAYNDLFVNTVKPFIEIYPSLIVAQAMALGDMFRREDYPLPEDLASKFSFTYSFMPVPTSGDFRIDVGNAALTEMQTVLQARLEHETASRVQNAMQDVMDRLVEHLKRMSDRLTSDMVDGEPKRRKFHDTLIDNALELCDVARTLNMVNDPKLEQVRYELEQIAKGVTPDLLRESYDVRENTRKKVDELLDKYSF
jgi:hypothetical protein